MRDVIKGRRRVETLTSRGATNTEPGAVATGSGLGINKNHRSPGTPVYNDGELNPAQTRSHPPPHAGCPRGDPGPLPVLYSSTHKASRVRSLISNA